MSKFYIRNFTVEFSPNTDSDPYDPTLYSDYRNILFTDITTDRYFGFEINPVNRNEKDNTYYGKLTNYDPGNTRFTTLPKITTADPNIFTHVYLGGGYSLGWVNPAGQYSYANWETFGWDISSDSTLRQQMMTLFDALKPANPDGVLNPWGVGDEVNFIFFKFKIGSTWAVAPAFYHGNDPNADEVVET